MRIPILYKPLIFPVLYRYDLLPVDVKYVDNEILPVSCETIPVWSAVNGNIYITCGWEILPVVGSVSVVSSSTSSSILTLFAALLSSKTNHN